MIPMHCGGKYLELSGYQRPRLAPSCWEFSQSSLRPLLTPTLQSTFDLTKNAPAVRTFLDRLKQFFSGRRLRHDIIDAVTDTENDDIETVFEAAAAMMSTGRRRLKDAVEALTRVLRITEGPDLAAR